MVRRTSTAGYMTEQLAGLELTFDQDDQLLRWYAELVAVGSAPLFAHPPARAAGEAVTLTLRLADGTALELTGNVLPPTQEGEPPRISLQPTVALRERVYVKAMARRGVKLNSPANGNRRHARFSTLLKVRYRSIPALFDEFVTNISEGGLFVKTEAPPALESEVSLSVQFPDGSEQLVRGTVVRVVTVEEAQRTRTVPGIGVRFAEASESFTHATEQLLEGFLRRPRRVLVIDDDFFFLQVLSDGLMTAGFEVATARGGRDGARKLVELLYDLDAVVLDLQMPSLDGRTLLERIRRMGSEMPLRVVLVSGLPEELVAPLVGPGGADAAVSKSHVLPELVERVRAALA